MPTFDPSPIPLTGLASVFVTGKWHREKTGNDRFELMPNVRCNNYHYVQGATPASAQFEYTLDNTGYYSWPYLFEDLWPITASGRYVVGNDDELIVYEFGPDGSRRLVFNGYAQLPQIDQAAGLGVSFASNSVHIRLWDTPLIGSRYRDASDPKHGDFADVDLPCWFNPSGKPNRTPEGFDQDQDTDTATPLFLDPLLVAVPGVTPLMPAFWDLGGFVRYVSQAANPDETYVTNPQSATGVKIDDYLRGPSPISDRNPMDLSNPATYFLEDILIRSFLAQGKTLPEAVDEQLGYYGFRMFLNTREDPDDEGAPINEVIIFRVDGLDGNAPKQLYYPDEGAVLFNGLPDYSAIGIARDGKNLVNEYQIETKEIGREVGVTLAPGFTISAGDTSLFSTFDSSNLANATADLKKKYRYFIYDEVGLGHWDFLSGTWVTGKPTSLDEIFGSPKGSDRQYVQRLRPSSQHNLFSVDDAGHPRKSELRLSRDYKGKVPGVWDGTGTWQSLGEGGWKANKTELGIEITADNPETWKIPKSDGTIVTADMVAAVTSLANPDVNNPRFTLMFITVIPSDRGIDAIASKRIASPTKFAVRRLIEAKDAWQLNIVDKSSPYNTTGKDVIVRDDTKAAQAQADAQRLATEASPIAGSFTIPGISYSYGVGDVIDKIQGRDISLLSNAGAPAGEGPRYPVVIGFSVNCQNPHTTTIKLEDRRSEPEGAWHGFGKSR